MAREVESRIEHVTVYASGARVRRIAGLQGDVPPIVRIGGLPIAMIDDSVRIEVDGPAAAVAMRVGVDAPATGAAAEEGAELRAARRRLLLAEAELARLEAAVDRLAAAEVVEDDPSDDAPAAWAAVVAARRALVGALAQRHHELRDRAAAARREVAVAKRALDAAVDRDQRASTARDARPHEVRKHVELELVAQGTGDVAIRVGYDVAAARWAPSYAARLEGDQVTIELRAVIAQRSGEDWTGVALAVSTAEPHRFTELPELAPQKIGRRQHEPVRRGFRPPPVGAEQLYADYDRDFPRRTTRPFTADDALTDSTFAGRVPEQAARGHALAELAKQSWDEESSRAKAPYGEEVTVMAAAPLAQRRSRAVGGGAPPAAKTMAPAEALSRVPEPPPPRPAPAEVVPRLDYGNLVMAGARAPERGRLVPAPPPYGSALVAEVVERAAAIAELALPPGCAADWAHAYDFAFAGDGAIDVASDGAWHAIAVASRAGTAKLRHVAVPREQADVFRLAELGNPFDGPMLPGPIDVYDRGQFVVTGELEYTPPGAKVEIGLGVDGAIKIARNVEFHEESTGVLRGALRLVHAIAIEIENASQRAVDLEVRERIPVTREGDDDVEVVLGRVDPAWERWTPEPDAPSARRLRGGQRWRIVLPPGGKRLLRAAYEVKIAAKHELVGGNRRES